MDITLDSYTFRANPSYSAIPYNRLDAAKRQAFLPWQQTSESYGLLYPTPGSDLPITAITRDTALLFFTMQTPGPLPDYILQIQSQQQLAAISALIFDCVLELSGPDGFLGGPEAVAIIGFRSQLSTSKFSGLSYSALQYAQELDIADPAILSLKLYFYNRLPATRSWCLRLPNQTAVLDFLHLLPGQKHNAAVQKFWSFPTIKNVWIPFLSRRTKRGFIQKPYKLYISPRLEVLPEIFSCAAEILGSNGAIQFKIGSDCYGLLRPDKFVAYFTNKEDLFEAASALGNQLAGTPVHGVPFTAEASSDGLISWGIDPAGISEIEGRSWRHWVSNRLAAGLIMARNIKDQKVEPWKLALERLSMEGVDTATFIPNSSWSGDHTL